MECPRCRAELPEVAHFCHICGQDQRSADLADEVRCRKPDEPVASPALISSIMPRSGRSAQAYRIALAIAWSWRWSRPSSGRWRSPCWSAFAIPIVYIVYDVNLWEDEPLPVAGWRSPTGS